jgi:DNA-binding NtrC family response regulator
LRFLENLRFMRVGGSKKLTADVRLVVATLRPLDAEVRAGRFRADLYYRIQALSLRVPALRERRADIAPLLAQFIAQLSARHGVRPPRVSREAKALLLRHDWPGNVRELRNVVESFCLLRHGRTVRASDLPEELRASASDRAPASSAIVSLDLDEGLDAATRALVQRALDLEDGSKARAAARLRISPRTLQRYAAAGRIDTATPRRPAPGRPKPRRRTAR